MAREFTMSRIFTPKEARYFCRGPIRAPSKASFRDLVERQLVPGRDLTENSKEFEEYRIQSLYEADRCLFLALSNHRRSEDLLTPSSAFWSCVTSYYASFYAASAIMSLLGVSVNPRFTVVDVAAGTPQSQRLAVQECPEEGPTGQSGGHRVFWDFFYTYIQNLRSYTPPELKTALQYKGPTPTWIIENRNTHNYDSFAALELCVKFRDSFREERFPLGLPDNFRWQLETTQSLINCALWLTHELSFETEALSDLCGGSSLRNRVERYIGLAGIPFRHGRPVLSKPTPTRRWLALST